MALPPLQSKLFVPQPRRALVPRPRLLAMLDAGLYRTVTLISAPAGFGKTTLLSEWLAAGERPTAWLSLDEGDNDVSRFLAYLVAALQTVAPTVGAGVAGVLEAPQPPPIDWVLTTLLNALSALPHPLVLVLDDYHFLDAPAIDQALTFFLEHLPPQLHVVIATREDPSLPLARFRARDQLTEVRAADLRFTRSEAAGFLNQAMGLNLSTDTIAALESRTEGWITGLQLAALALQGAISAQGDAAAIDFIRSFTGSHRFVMDYLLEEVLQQQPEPIQRFLLRTSLLDRLCGPLCDALLASDADPLPIPGSSQETLEYLERANLFVVPLDTERRWYRYHHLFAELLRQRLHTGSFPEAGGGHVAELHRRASQWYEDNGLLIEAFHHAAAANDVARAARLVEGRMPLYAPGVVRAILDWLASLPKEVLDARPSLWVSYASLPLVIGQTIGVEARIEAAEAALLGAEPNEKHRNLIGQLATARGVLALTQYQVETMMTQSRRALEHLHPNNLSIRTTANWTLGFASLMQKDYVGARQALTEALALSQASGDVFTTILATVGLGSVQEAQNQLHHAAETYRRSLQLAGDQPLQIIYEAHLGLARLLYEWNELDAAEQHGQQSLQLARQYESVIDRFVLCELFLARLKLARGDVEGAAALVAGTDQAVRQHNFVHRLSEVAATQVLVLLRQGKFAAAGHLAQRYALPSSQARVFLAQGEPVRALAVLGAWRQQAEARAWADERLKAMALQVVALQGGGDTPAAVQLLGEVLGLAAPGGFVRLFLDEGPLMARLVAAAAAQGVMPAYTQTLLAAFEAEMGGSQSAPVPPAQPLIEPLSERELEVLGLLAQGLSNAQISERLFLALSTVKGHIGRIFDKLQVQNRTQAVARGRELGLL